MQDVVVIESMTSSLMFMFMCNKALVVVVLVSLVVVVLLVSHGAPPSVVEVSWWTSELLIKEDVSKGSLSHWLSAAKQPTRLSSGPGPIPMPGGGQKPTRGLSGLPPVELVDAVVGTVEQQLS